LLDPHKAIAAPLANIVLVIGVGVAHPAKSDFRDNDFRFDFHHFQTPVRRDNEGGAAFANGFFTYAVIRGGPGVLGKIALFVSAGDNFSGQF
jgi:hypothetical protein